eukprot:TRINITY_DN9967_c0_g1_i1.p1 TRINITY_DN9967_c0_g1~~TRINITY_DN9967_c0_g1_i1.p1  ORF type:complete len:140 (+),score=29.52 TRINITY_DN9967_c0_g1_i1:218-637(+)
MESEGPAGAFSARKNAPVNAVPLFGFGKLVLKNDNLRQASSDEELDRYLKEASAQKRPVVVNYGAAWCHACKQMLPTFVNLSSEYSNPLFIYAEADKCSVATKDIPYTPTFQFFRNGQKVDEFYGAGAQRLRDRVWMQS